MKSVTKIIPRYQETDKMGVIHHSVYPIWYEYGRCEFCKQIGFPFHTIESRGIMQAVINLNLEYKAPAHFGDELTLITKVKSYSRIKVEFVYELYNQNNTLLNIGSTVLAWLDNNFKPLNIIKDNKDIYDAIANSVEE